MSDNTTMYVILAVILAGILIVAIVKSTSKVRIKLPGMEAGVDPEEKRTISVAERSTFENVDAGNVTGERRESAGGQAARDVSVMNDAVVRGGKIGDITGVEGRGLRTDKT
jgi:hypothetical protein